MEKFYGNLPSGVAAKNDREYVDEWRKLCEPIEKFMGLRHHAFDPDVDFEFGGHFISLPVWFLSAFNRSAESIVAADPPATGNDHPASDKSAGAH